MFPWPPRPCETAGGEGPRPRVADAGGVGAARPLLRELRHPRLIALKGALFLASGAGAAALLLLEAPSLRAAALLAVTVWAFCRAYYFAFYVMQHYVDPAFRFSGLGAFLVYLWRARNR